jgi:formylglycine-generating enzyme required for sulfatase activity
MVGLVLVACSAAAESPPTAQLESTAFPEPTGKPEELVETDIPPSPVPTDTPLPVEVDPTATEVEPAATNEPIDLPEKITETNNSEMLLIPAGEFQMGSSVGGSGELPIHTVWLDSFYIDLFEVTHEQFSAFLDSEGNQEEGGETWLDADATGLHLSSSEESWQVEEGYESHPIFELTWYAANAYCQWRGARLPTEAEWEKAARGTILEDGRVYPWGIGEIDNDKANFNRYYEETLPVGSLPAGVSSYGVHDLAGNISEFTADWYDRDYYSNSPIENPTGPESGDMRVVRGGSYYDQPHLLLSTYRLGVNPNWSNNVTGFRCALSP